MIRAYEVEITFAGLVFVEADDDESARKAINSQLAPGGITGMDGTLPTTHFVQDGLVHISGPVDVPTGSPDMYAREDDR